MKILSNDNAVLRDFRKIFVNDGGTLRQIQKVFGNDNATLRQFYSAESIVLPASQALNSDDDSGQIVTAKLLVDNDGGFRKFVESAGSGFTQDFGEWHTGHPTAGLGDSVFLRMSHQTGIDRYLSGSGLDSFVQLNANADWTFQHSETGPNTDISTYLLEWSSDGVSVDVGSYILTVTLQNLSP